MAYKYSKGTFALDSIRSKDDSDFLDDKKLKFGTDGDAHFEYDEDGADVLQYAGADMRLFHGASGKLQFRDDALYINSSADGQLDLGADSKVMLTAGTVGASADLEVGDDLKLKSDAAVAHFGADGDVTLTHVADTGLLLNSSMQVQFGDSATHIKQVSDSNLEIEADGSLIIDSPVLDLQDDAVIVKFGDDSDVTLTHVADTGLLLNSSRQLQFGDSGTYMRQAADGELNLVADGKVSVTGKLDVSGDILGGGKLELGSASITEAELEMIDDVTGGTVSASKFVAVDSNKDISGFRNVTATGYFEIGSAQLTESELEMIDGITAGTGAASKALVLDANRAIGNIQMLTASHARITNLDVVTINSVNQTEETLEISDKLIVSALSASSANSSGGGLRIGGGQDSNGHASLLWDHANSALDFNIGGTTEMRLADGVLRPETDNDVDLGASGAEFKDLYLDGVAYIDDLRADALGAALNCASQAMTNVNIDSGAIDGAVIGANDAAAGTFAALVGTSLSVSDGNITNVGDIALDSITADDGSSFSFGSNWTAASRTCANLGTVTTADINGGSVDGVVIGAASRAAASVTALASNYSGSVTDPTYNVVAADFFIGVDSSSNAVTVKLPKAADVAAGRMYVVKDVKGKAGDSGLAISITGSHGDDLIDGATGAITIDSEFGAVNLVAGGAGKWLVW
jgi:hypothetical protein